MSRAVADSSARPSVVERYSVASGRGTDADIHLAAGMASNRHAFGLALLRMRAEFDAIRGQIHRNSDAAKARADAVKHHQAEAKRHMLLAERYRRSEAGDPDARGLRKEAQAAADRHLDLAKAAERRSPAEIVSERAEILLAMSGLDQVKGMVWAWACVIAERRGLKVGNDGLAKLAGKAIDVHLDEICHACSGTGMVGNVYAGETPRKCGACRGSGHRRDAIGMDVEQREFTAALLAFMDKAAAEAGAAMSSALKFEPVAGVSARAPGGAA